MRKNMFMRKGVILILILLFFGFGINKINAQATSASNNLIAQPVPDRTVSYSVSDTGVSKPITWGLDLAWLDKGNVLRGIAFMGANRVDIIRSSFTPTAALVDGQLPAVELDELNQRLAIIDMVRPNMNIVLNNDAEPSIDPWYKEDANKWANWTQLFEVTTKLHEERGHHVVAISPLNEPDYQWNGQGSVNDFYSIASEMKQNPFFDSIRISGGNTLNCDQALPWYNVLKDKIDEGNTHQLAGNFNNYASFFEAVRANGHHATNDELHNVMEAMVGVEYGMQTGIWWGTAEYARGEFVKASDGVRLAYSEHRPNWTSAAVYKDTAGKIQAFGGTSERQGVTTSYRFVSRDKDVFYDGYGPQREYTMVLPGGVVGSYQNGQTNAERVVNISWGDDIQPAIEGKYLLVNRNSGKVMEVAEGSVVNGAAIQQNTYIGETYQQWNVKPVSSRVGGDFSYFKITGVRSGKSLDVYNFSLDNGGDIFLWGIATGANQQWYLEYVEDGWFYIRSRLSAKCVAVTDSGTGDGAIIQQWDVDGGTNQQWRFIPVDATVEFEAPEAPGNLAATANAESIRLDWSASTEKDVAEYTIFRSESAGGPYNTIARNVTSTSFVDNTTTTSGQFFYTIKAVDNSQNRSGHSNEVSATATGNNDMVAHLKFDGNTLDTSINLNHSAAYGEIEFFGNTDSRAIVLNGKDAFLQLPANLANQQEITIASWVFWNGGANFQRIFDFGNDQKENMYLTPSSNTGKLLFSIKHGDTEQSLEAPILPTDEWSHVAVTLGASGASIYINGGLVAESQSFTLSPLDIKPMLNYIGRSQNKVPLFKGNIDDFRVYNYALSATEVALISEVEHAVITDIRDTECDFAGDLSLWPIPTNDVLYVNYPAMNYNIVSTLTVYNTNGNVVLNKNLKYSNDTKLNVSNLPGGIYILKLTNSNETLMQKLVIKH